jgi:PhzF family phenazine biosynthesis protein
MYMGIPIFQVDAFSSKVFGGNPAAVCLLDYWLPDNVLQSIANENNLSETAFLVGKGADYELRWFTPSVEIDLCGHATLASGFVIFSFPGTSSPVINFKTASGTLKVERSGDLLSMDFPARKPVRIDNHGIITEALGIEPVEVLRSRDLMAVFDNESQIREISPDFDKLSELHDAFGIIVTAGGDSADFVSRFFAPNAGIPEDPVTGSSHCSLIPYWSERLGKSELYACQLSQRGGEIFGKDMGNRVRISGRAGLYSKGEIYV